MKNELFVGFNDIFDAEKFDVLNSMADALKSHIVNGGVVIVEHRIGNAMPEMIGHFSNVDSLDSWLKSTTLPPLKPSLDAGA